MDIGSPTQARIHLCIKWAHLPGGALPTLGNAFNELISLKLGKIESRCGYSHSIWLDPDNNEIEQIESGALNELILLEELNLYNNQLTVIKSGKIKAGTFSQLSNCTWLDLNYSEIGRIESVTLNELISLE